MAMWFNCLRGLAEAGELTVAELEQRARMPTNLDGMRRWGLITIDGIGRVRRATPRPQARRASLLALTRWGDAADAVWRPLPEAIEHRWRERFGSDALDALRSALVAVAQRIDAPLPDFMPIGRISGIVEEHPEPRGAAERAADAQLPLVSLLARALMHFELDYERAGRLSLHAWSNLLRVLSPDQAIAVRRLPQLTGVSKEALAMMIGRLERSERVAVEPFPPGRGRQARLTSPGGTRAQAAGRDRIAATLEGWKQRYGESLVTTAASALVPIVGDGTRAGSPLFAGLEPPPGSWRSRVRPPDLLPWYPMVLHRGGYPDGS